MSTPRKTAETTAAERYLTFRLGDATYGIGILSVQEIIRLLHITRVPRVPEFVRGVVNLRGRVIPVVDLRCRFGMPLEPDTERTCVVVTQIRGEHGPLSMGVLVEDVAEVVDIPLEQTEDVPDFGPGIRTEFLTGIGRLDERVVMLLDIDAVLSLDDTRTVEGLASDGEKQGVER